MVGGVEPAGMATAITLTKTCGPAATSMTELQLAERLPRRTMALIRETDPEASAPGMSMSKPLRALPLLRALPQPLTRQGSVGEFSFVPYMEAASACTSTQAHSNDKRASGSSGSKLPVESRVSAEVRPTVRLVPPASVHTSGEAWTCTIRDACPACQPETPVVSIACTWIA